MNWLPMPGEDGKNSAGAYDKLLEASLGTEETLENKSYITTDDSHTSITWSIVNESNMRNNQNNQGIEPGTSGMLKFYIISHKEGALNVTLDLGLTGYTNGTGGTIVKSEKTAQELVKGHVLLFAGYEQGTNSYEGWISEDADPWTMTLDNGRTLTPEMQMERLPGQWKMRKKTPLIRCRFTGSGRKYLVLI